MFRARRMMALNAMIERLREERNQAAASDEERAIAALLDAPSDADSDADNEATTVLNISAVLAHLEMGRLDQDRTGVQVLGALSASRGEVVLICPGDPDEEISEIIRGPWVPDEPMVQRADEEVSEIIRGPWTEPVEHIALAPEELEAAILAARLEADEESSEIIAGPWMADEEATCMYDQAELEALLRGR